MTLLGSDAIRCQKGIKFQWPKIERRGTPSYSWELQLSSTRLPKPQARVGPRFSQLRTRVFALVQASFDCFALHRFGTIICVRNPWAGRCLKVFGTRFSLFLSASLCKQRSVAENSKDQAYVLPNVLTFGQKLIGSYRSALEMLQLLSYSTSRKILRHPKLDSGARHTQTGRKGLYGARWGWGLTRTVHQEQHWIHQAAL